MVEPVSSKPLDIRLDDHKSEQVRRSHHDAIVEQQGLPFSSARVISDVSLADGVVTPVSHGLGRLPLWVRESCVRGAASTGRIEEVRDGSVDRRKQIALKATGWGATVTVDVVVL
jgi:hypothetical protein